MVVEVEESSLAYQGASAFTRGLIMIQPADRESSESLSDCGSDFILPDPGWRSILSLLSLSYNLLHPITIRCGKITRIAPNRGAGTVAFMNEGIFY